MTLPTREALEIRQIQSEHFRGEPLPKQGPHGLCYHHINIVAVIDCIPGLNA